MNGLIVQKAKIFDPRTLPDYIQEATNSRKAPFSRDVEGHLYQDTTKLGLSLYPGTIAYLQPLNVSGISNLRGRFDNEKLPEGIVDLGGLTRNVGAIAFTWPRFDATINPTVPVGTNSVRISMYYDGSDDSEVVRREMGQIAEDYRQGKITPKDEYHERTLKGIAEAVEREKQNPSEYKQRSVCIAARFDDPQSARIGLRQLGTIYPEMLFEEELLAVGLPQEIAEAHRKALDYLHQHWLYDHRLGQKPDYEFDDADYHRFTKDANLQHMRFLTPHLQGLGIVPITASYFYGDLKPTERRSVPITSFGDVVDIIANESYDRPHIPEISAMFGDRKVEMDFSRGNGTFGIFDFGVVIENRGRERTLEDILERVQSS